MKRLLFSIALIFLAFYSQAQFRLAVNGSPSWSSLGGGLYSATVTFHADLTGNSYAVAGIVDTMRLFTSRGQVFEIDSVWGKTFSQATLRVEYLEGVSSAPVGQSMVYNPNGSVFIPDVPFGSTGATAQLNQAVVTYNASKAGTSSPPFDSTDISAGGLGITDASAALVNYIRQPGVDSTTAHRTDINNLQTLTGRPDGSTNLGTMGQGTTYPDNPSIKTFADSTDAKLGRVQPSIASLPAGFAITSAEKIASSDSTYTFQKQVNQLRDSTLIGVATVDAIMNLPSTTPEFSRVLVKNTGATFLVVDSVDIKVSDTVDDFASTSPVSGSVWVYKSDTTAVVKILGTTKYAIYDPIAGAIPISRFSKSSLNDSESLQKAIDYSFWVRNMYRNNNTNVTTAISPVMANKVLVDKDLELTDSIYIRYGTIIEGISLPGLDRYYEPVLKFNLNSATRNGTFLDQFGGATTGKSGELRNLRFEATSAINAMVNLNYPNDFSVYNVKLDGGASRFAKYGLKTFSFVHEEIYDLSVKDVSDAAVYLSRENSNIGTTITLNYLKVIECKYGILADSASTYDLYVNRPSFETVDSSILSLARGIRAYISEIYTEGCTAFNIIKVGTGTSGGSTSGKYFISNSKIETNLSVSSGSIINSNFVELLDVSNVEMSDKLTSITTTSSTALLNLRNVTMNDITTNTAAFDRGALTGVNSATNVNVDNVLVSSLGYGAGTINSKKVRTALIDDTASSLRGTYNIQYATSAGSGARDITRRLAGTQLAPLAVPAGAVISTKDWEAYVGSLTGNVIAARITVAGNGAPIADVAGGFPTDMFIGLCNGMVGAASNHILQIRGDKNSVGIGTYPVASAALDISSTSRGLLIPRMTTTQRNAISSPATGLQVYNSSLNKLNYYNGTSWRALVDSTTLAAFTPSGTWLLGGQNITAENSIGSNDAFGVNFKTNNVNRLRISSGGRVFAGTLTDFRFSVSDTAEITSGANGWIISSGFSRLVSNGLIALQANNSTGATAMVLPDNTANAYVMSISGGANVLSATTTDGAEATNIGTSSAGGTLNLVSEKTIVAGSLGIARRTITASGTSALAQGDYYVRLDATAGAQTITLPSPTYNMVLRFKRIDNNAGTAIIFTGTVDGTTNPNSTTGGSPILLLATQYKGVEITWNGTDWDITDGF